VDFVKLIADDEAAEGPINASERSMLLGQLDAAQRKLTSRERDDLPLRYGLGDGHVYTLKEMPLSFQIGRERIRQIEPEVIRKVRQPLRRRLPGEKPEQ
jgi:RNA polymerase nonessential primary-like sigma factor